MSLNDVDGKHPGSAYARQTPPVRLNVRADGRIERLCEHNVGHPVGHIAKWQDWMGVHGCDGCCTKWEED